MEEEYSEEMSEPEGVRYVEPPVERKEEAPEIGIIRELSPAKVMRQLRMDLKGYYWDYEKEKYIRVEGMKPLMNDKGIAKYLSIMSSIITDLVTFSFYKEDEIKRLTQFVMKQSIPTIYFNWKEYGIEKKSDLKIVSLKLFNLTLAAFKKALGAGDRNVVRGTVTESMMTRQGYQGEPSQPKRRGVLSKINPFVKDQY